MCDEEQGAYAGQSESLGASNRRGQRGEEIVRNLTGGVSTRVPYTNLASTNLLLQSDCVIGEGTERELIISVTHTQPDTRGHSNENKVQLKLGELWLWKTHRSNRRVVIVITGNQNDWLPWCLSAFRIFFDDTICEWEEGFEDRIRNAFENVEGRNAELWSQETCIRTQRDERAQDLLDMNEVLISRLPIRTLRSMATSRGIQGRSRLTPDDLRALFSNGEEHSQASLIPRNSRLRHGYFEEILPNYWRRYDEADQIPNLILRRCMMAAEETFNRTNGRSGIEWRRFRRSENTGTSIEQFWECRTFFNPAEAVIEEIIQQHGIPYLGGIARDVDVPSFMTLLARESGSFEEFNNTKMSEDFVLMYNRGSQEGSIYIQSKSSGGGLEGHGKAIQNRAKEQVARNLLYRLRPIIDDNSEVTGFEYVNREFNWIGIIDNNWALPAREPRKNLHMLLLAGYDQIFYADSLVDEELCPLDNSPLSDYINSLQDDPDINFVNPMFSEFPTEHDEGAHGEPGATNSDFDY
jgi:hypothetical protein